MIRSSRGVRLPFFSGSTSTPNSSRSASSSSVKLTTRGLRLHAGKIGNALGHALLPSVGGRDGGQSPSLLFEFQGPFGKLPRLLHRQRDTAGSDHGGYLLQAILAHGL